MSRIGKKPIEIPTGVEVSVDNNVVKAKGPKGELSFEVHRYINVEVKDNELVCSIGHPSKQSSALWGTTRARLANIVIGVNEGFSKDLELHGVGYKAALKGKDLELIVGYSHPVVIEAPEGISFVVEKEKITVSGHDLVRVGQIAAEVRAVRKPEPYKGKGIRYAGEHVRRKVGKVVGASE